MEGEEREVGQEEERDEGDKEVVVVEEGEEGDEGEEWKGEEGDKEEDEVAVVVGVQEPVLVARNATQRGGEEEQQNWG